jgi:hypothetical protein
MLHPALAVAAEPTVEMRFDRDEVPLTHRLDAGTDRIDEAGHLMARHDPSVGMERALEDLRVRAADPDRNGQDPNLSGAGLEYGDLLQAQIVGPVEADALHATPGRLPRDRGEVGHLKWVTYRSYRALSDASIEW